LSQKFTSSHRVYTLTIATHSAEEVTTSVINMQAEREVSTSYLQVTEVAAT
ncbi:hypothetical protein J6590_076425, partial [Homalodisca vitripennis]